MRLLILLLPLLSCSKGGSEVVRPTERPLSDSAGFVTVPFKPSSTSQWMTSRCYPYNAGDADNDFNVTSAHTLLIDSLRFFNKTDRNEMDKWGGHASWTPDEITSGNTQGFWRTGMFRGRPVMVDPDGHVAILHGVNSVSPGASANYSDVAKANYRAKYSNAYAWTLEMAPFLQKNAINFYTGGSTYADKYREACFPQSDEKFFQAYFKDWTPSHIETLSVLRSFQWRYSTYHPGQKLDANLSRFAFMFDPAYDAAMDKFIQTVTGFFKSDKNLIGYYIDNELAFVYGGTQTGESKYNSIKLSSWLAYNEDSDAGKAARAYAVKFMTDRGVQAKAENITEPLQQEFLETVTEMYFSKHCSTIRKYDPDHLILGCRLHGLPMRTSTVVRICAKYCDVLSINYYSRWEPEEPYMRWLQGFLGKKPFMITEFYTKSAEYEFDNSEGAGWIVKTQADRGKFYQNFCIRLLRGGCGGWQWFELIDRGVENSSNKGLITVDFDYVKYNDFHELYRQMNLNIYNVFDWLNPADR